MGFLDWLTGNTASNTPQQRPTYAPGAQAAPAGGPARSADEIAIERYRYLLRTAPPETIEQAHAEAFAKLTPAQRAQVFQELSASAAPGEAPQSDSPDSLARSATRSELRSPGSIERTFSQRPGGGMFGGNFASTMLGTVAGFVIGSAIADAFLPDFGGTDATAADGGSSDSGGATDAGGSTSADGAGGWDGGGGDFGGGDFGGGDFGF
ncbi:hypothetical protein [Orlajensenia leifsoniae]|uniref:Uncharacterized protein n=1 Tax=Orlajensenia leifsoniae TaxID=2561933 RepID=A0A4Y9R6M8_9MICO|nr:hypothetical protein [Leifsonia flava]TFV99313.1 hypothetical protein E4M00_07445 [Leifsonia flava]